MSRRSADPSNSSEDVLNKAKSSAQTLKAAPRTWMPTPSAGTGTAASPAGIQQSHEFAELAGADFCELLASMRRSDSGLSVGSTSARPLATGWQGSDLSRASASIVSLPAINKEGPLSLVGLCTALSSPALPPHAFLAASSASPCDVSCLAAHTAPNTVELAASAEEDGGEGHAVPHRVAPLEDHLASAITASYGVSAMVVPATAMADGPPLSAPAACGPSPWNPWAVCGLTDWHEQGPAAPCEGEGARSRSERCRGGAHTSFRRGLYEGCVRGGSPRNTWLYE